MYVQNEFAGRSVTLNGGTWRSVLLLAAILVPGVVMAQGYDGGRPWARLPYSPTPHSDSERPKRYNPWTQMRETKRLPPPEYRGDADENAPKYHEPDPTYRELPKRHEELSDPRADASPWSEQRYTAPGYGYAPAYPATGTSGFPWYTPYGYGGGYPMHVPWPWSATGGW